MTRNPLVRSILEASSKESLTAGRLTLSILVFALSVAGLALPAAPVRAVEPVAQEGAEPTGKASMEAELELRRKMMAHPEQAEVYVELADLQVSRGATDEAVSTLVGAVNRFTGSGEPKKAVLLMTKAADLKPDDPELQFFLGKAHTQNRDFEAAEPPLRRALELGSDDPSVLVFLGAVLWESGRMAEAEPVYRQAIEATGRAYMPLSQLGRLLLWQGQYEEATTLLREATQRNPRDVGTLFDLGEALRGSNQIDEAIGAYRRVLAVAPNFKRARYGLAMMLARQGDREGSQAEFEIYNRLILEAEESNRLAEIETGEVDRAGLMIREGQVEEAISHLEGLEETVEVLLARAQAYRAAGSLDAALESLQRAVTLDPSRQDVRQMLAGIRMEKAQAQ